MSVSVGIAVRVVRLDASLSQNTGPTVALCDKPLFLKQVPIQYAIAGGVRKASRPLWPARQAQGCAQASAMPGMVFARR